MYEVPNDWQELEEEEESEGAQELLLSYGPFSVILYSRVKKLKLFSVTEPENFLKSLLEFYIKNIKHADKSEEAICNIKTLVGLFPPIKKFCNLLKFHRQQGAEMIFFKLAIDILYFYYKATDGPLFVKLQKDVVPLAINLYKTLSGKALDDITEMIRSSVAKSNANISYSRGSSMVCVAQDEEGIQEVLSE